MKGSPNTFIDLMVKITEDKLIKVILFKYIVSIKIILFKYIISIKVILFN
jgi:hypothetical protein